MLYYTVGATRSDRGGQRGTILQWHFRARSACLPRDTSVAGHVTNGYDPRKDHVVRHMATYFDRCGLSHVYLVHAPNIPPTPRTRPRPQLCTTYPWVCTTFHVPFSWILRAYCRFTNFEHTWRYVLHIRVCVTVALGSGV